LTTYTYRRTGLCFLVRHCTSEAAYQADSLTYRDAPVLSLRHLLGSEIRRTTCLSPCKATGPCFGTLCLPGWRGPSSVALPPALCCKHRTRTTIRYPYALSCFAWSGWVAPIGLRRCPHPILSDLIAAVMLTSITEGPLRGRSDLHRWTLAGAGM